MEKHLAIVVIPQPPPPPPPANTGCDYQVEIGNREYKCMTSQEYHAYKNPVKTADLPFNTGEFLLVYGIISAIIILVFIIYKLLRRHPNEH